MAGNNGRISQNPMVTFLHGGEKIPHEIMLLWKKERNDMIKNYLKEITGERYYLEAIYDF